MSTSPSPPSRTPSSSSTVSGRRRASGSTGSSASRAATTAVVAPTYPGFEGEVEALRRGALADRGRHHARHRRAPRARHLRAPSPPTLVGHGFGGTLVQILLDRGFGAAGIAIASVPTEGVRAMTAIGARTAFPVLHNPANRHRAVGFTPEAVPPRVHHHARRGRVAGGLRPLPHPRPGRLGLGRRARQRHARPRTRGSTTTRPTAHRCCSSPAARTRSSPRRSQEELRALRHSGAHTDYMEFGPRDHFTIGAPEWEKIANAARTWAIDHAQAIRHAVERHRR